MLSLEELEVERVGSWKPSAILVELCFVMACEQPCPIHPSPDQTSPLHPTTPTLHHTTSNGNACPMVQSLTPSLHIPSSHPHPSPLRFLVPLAPLKPPLKPPLNPSRQLWHQHLPRGHHQRHLQAARVGGPPGWQAPPAEWPQVEHQHGLQHHHLSCPACTLQHHGGAAGAKAAAAAAAGDGPHVLCGGQQQQVGVCVQGAFGVWCSVVWCGAGVVVFLIRACTSGSGERGRGDVVGVN